MLQLKKLLEHLIPPLFRGRRMLSLINTIGESLETTYQDLKGYIEDTRAELNLNGQTIILEYGLNQRFDPDRKRIFIKHSELNLQYTYNDDEGEPAKYFYSTYETKPQGYAQEYGYFMLENPTDIGADFEVVYPIELSSQEDDIRGFVETYKAAGKLFITSTS